MKNAPDWYVTIQMVDGLILYIQKAGDVTGESLSDYLEHCWRKSPGNDHLWDVYLIAKHIPQGQLQGKYETFYGTITVEKVKCSQQSTRAK